MFAALAGAAIEDGWRLRISNLTCLAVLVLALAAAAIHGFSAEMWENLLVCCALLALGTFAFSTGALGGGDVKLLASLGLWVDLRGALGLLASVFLTGGIVALLFILGRALFRSNVKAHRRERRIPYGIAIVAGTLIFAVTARNAQTRPLPGLPASLVHRTL